MRARDDGRGSMGKMKTTCDFLIVGAGLSGCALGFFLARAGADVLALELLDAKEKNKLCAGAIEEGCRERLTGTFGKEMWDDLRPARFEVMRFRIAGRECRWRKVFYGLPRKRLDDYALNRYTGAGGRLMDRISVKAIDTAKGEAVCDNLRAGERFTVRFRTIVGADGAASATRRLITGKNPESAPSIAATVPSIGDELLLEYRYGEVGYAWYIPQGDSATVGA